MICRVLVVFFLSFSMTQTGLLGSDLPSEEIKKNEGKKNLSLQETLAEFKLLEKQFKDIENKMSQEDLGEKCQVPQEEILHVLDDLIELARPRQPENPEQGEVQAPPPSSGSGAPGEGQNPSGQQASGQRPEQGAGDSVFRRGSNKVGELRKFVDQRATSSWGKLPAKEREAMKQEMKEKLPKENARWVEKFSERLASGEAQ